MKGEKNIDRLFQEKMKDLEAVPSSRVWSGIESKLQKKKRRVLPYWWFSGGVAALLIISLFLLPIINDDPKDIILDSKDIITTTPKDLVKKVDTSKIHKSIIPQIFKEEESDIAKKESVKKEPNIIATNTPSFIEQTEKGKIDDQKILPTTEKEEEAVISLNKKVVPSNKNSDPIQKIEEKKKTTLLPKKDFIAEVNKSKDLVEEKNVSRNWSVSPVFAVLSSNSFAGSSPLASNLSGGSTKGDNTYSYGVKVNYKMNSKWTIQTGIHVQKMRYSTKNNSIAPSTSTISAINSVNVEPPLKSFSFNANGLTNTATSTSIPQGLMVFLTNNEAVINQSFDYIELPIEIKYNIFSGKKLSTHIVTGFSSLFLTTNKLSVESGNFSEFLGEANNLNSMNFSGNLGIDFDYYFDKHWTLNINPMIKTQLSTFSENTSDFKPYSIGVYSGITYSF